MGTDYLLIDSKNLLWRSASVMNLSSGETKTGGTFGFFKGILKTREQFGGKVIACWDDWDNGPKARKDMYPEYKRRKPDPERERLVKEVADQMVDVRELLKHLGVRQTRSLCWEADDVMATLARKLDGNVVIYTGDRDLFQCINKRVTVARPMPYGGTEEYDATKFTKEFCVSVPQYVDYKAMVGDASDNIPGCKGIGPKTAVSILKEHGTLDAAIQATVAHDGALSSWQRKMLEGQEMVELSKKLSTVNSHVTLRNSFGCPDDKLAKRILMKYQMSSLLTQFSKLKDLRWE